MLVTAGTAGVVTFWDMQQVSNTIAEESGWSMRDNWGDLHIHVHVYVIVCHLIFVFR